jgi:gliding motility-associated-like protein
VKVTSPDGCSTTRNIEIINTPKIDLGGDMTVCEGQIIELKSTIGNVAPNLVYQWSTGETTPIISPKKSGMYILALQQSNCKASDSVKININPLPKIKADETTCRQKSIDAGGLENNLTFEWQGISETKPIIGCSLIRTITVNGLCNPRIYAPDIFTPNGDNLNDKFRVILDGGNIIGLDIYNRWGNIVFSEEQSNPEWDGKYKGDFCQNDTFAYVLRYKNNKDNSISEYRGTIILIR